jgi:hypothetical protein
MLWRMGMVMRLQQPTRAAAACLAGLGFADLAGTQRCLQALASNDDCRIPFPVPPDLCAMTLPASCIANCTAARCVSVSCFGCLRPVRQHARQSERRPSRPLRWREFRKELGPAARPTHLELRAKLNADGGGEHLGGPPHLTSGGIRGCGPRGRRGRMRRILSVTQLAVELAGREVGIKQSTAAVTADVRRTHQPIA